MFRVMGRGCEQGFLLTEGKMLLDICRGHCPSRGRGAALRKKGWSSSRQGFMYLVIDF